ncbi:MAG: LiaF-related protein [Ignavibacteriaceae bacterium]|nr:LiaF-related protein [Ignavibacteriaceae bacterium]
MHEHRNFGSRVILGMILIAIGVIYLAKAFYFPFDIEIFSFPFILVVIGIIIMLNSGNKLFGALVSIFGLILYFGDHIVIWPFFFILWGIYIIFKNRSRQHRAFDYHKYDSSQGSDPNDKKDFRDDIADFVKSEKNRFYDSSIRKDYLDDISVFGGGHKVIHSDSFKGGNITAIFGGSEIDLTQCKLAPGENIIDVVIIFGGTTIVVPNNWDVILNVTSLFGGFSNKKSRYIPSATEPAGTLIIKGVCLFGGGEIKSY